jgi:hypothetical protein
MKIAGTPTQFAWQIAKGYLNSTGEYQIYHRAKLCLILMLTFFILKTFAVWRCSYKHCGQVSFAKSAAR